MSSSQYQRTVNSLDKEVADLSKKKSQSEKEVANLSTNIAKAQKELNQAKSDSTKVSKIKQIETLQKKLAAKQSEVATYGKKIAEKTAKRATEYQRLQRALADEQKKQQKENEKLQKTYKKAIDSLTQRLTVSDIISNTNSFSNEEYDVFLSHAWEDKETFVDNFVNELENLGIRVWYDKKKILWGDSMRTRIDDGLRKSKFGIVILSPNYIAEGKYWTKEELNGLFQLESINGKKILPIWYNLNKAQIMDFSPMIANKKAIIAADATPEEIANELKNLLTLANME